MKTIGILLLCAAALHAAEAVAPDTCKDGVCLSGVRWKKGVVEHTLVGVVSPEGPDAIQSVELLFEYSDTKKHGNWTLRLKNITGKMPFYFKVNYGNVKWTESTFQLTATAIIAIEPLKRDDLACRFKSLGSRLGITIENGSDKDLVLDYQLLTLTHSGTNLRLNGSHGKYSDLSNPNPPTLISAKTTQTEEFIPMGSASFTNGEWVEDWRMHRALIGEQPSLALSIKIGGETQLEKLPLTVRFAKLAVHAAVPIQAK